MTFLEPEGHTWNVSPCLPILGRTFCSPSLRRWGLTATFSVSLDSPSSRPHGPEGCPRRILVLSRRQVQAQMRLLQKQPQADISFLSVDTHGINKHTTVVWETEVAVPLFCELDSPAPQAVLWASLTLVSYAVPASFRIWFSDLRNNRLEGRRVCFHWQACSHQCAGNLKTGQREQRGKRYGERLRSGSTGTSDWVPPLHLRTSTPSGARLQGLQRVPSSLF